MNLVLLGSAAVAILMLVLWLIHLRTGNASIVDAGWAGGLAMLGLFAVTPPLAPLAPRAPAGRAAEPAPGGADAFTLVAQQAVQGREGENRHEVVGGRYHRLHERHPRRCGVRLGAEAWYYRTS